MEKMYELEVNIFTYYEAGIWKKRLVSRQSGGWLHYIMAESEEDAKEKFILKYNKAHPDDGVKKEFHFYYISSWDNWTLRHAMSQLNAKQFLEYAKQNNLISLFPERD